MCIAHWITLKYAHKNSDLFYNLLNLSNKCFIVLYGELTGIDKLLFNFIVQIKLYYYNDYIQVLISGCYFNVYGWGWLFNIFDVGKTKF